MVEGSIHLPIPEPGTYPVSVTAVGDGLVVASLCEAVGKQSDTISAQADQIVELVRANMTLSRKLSELVTHS